MNLDQYTITIHLIKYTGKCFFMEISNPMNFISCNSIGNIGILTDFESDIFVGVADEELQFSRTFISKFYREL